MKRIDGPLTGSVMVYAVWLKDVEEPAGEKILDCYHLTTPSLLQPAQVEKYVMELIKENPQGFSIGDTPLARIKLTAIAMAQIGHGEVYVNYWEGIPK